MTKLELQSSMARKNNFIKNQWIRHKKRNGLASKICNIITVGKAPSRKLHKDRQNPTLKNAIIYSKRILPSNQSIFTQVKIWLTKVQKNSFYQEIHQNQKVVKS